MKHFKAFFLLITIIPTVFMNSCENAQPSIDSRIDSHIVFSSIRWWNYDIFIADSFGENVTHITKNQWLDFSPTISSDGKKLAFISDRDGNREIYMADLVWMDGYIQWEPRNLRNISNSKFHEWTPKFSPDGRRLVFSSYDQETDNYDIFIYSLSDNTLQNLTQKIGYEINPQFSPDGSFIIYQSWRKGLKEIFLMNLLEKNEMNISRSIKSNDIISDNYSFSPDGQKIIFTSDRQGSKNIYIMNANGANQIALTKNEFDNYNPSFSPDGQKITFTSNRRGDLDVYIMDSDGSNQKNISRNIANDWSPLFLPNGKEIIFLSDRDGNWEVYKANTKSFLAINITNNPSTDYSFTVLPFNINN